MAAYTEKLVLLHKMLRGAMKCKQTVDVEQVEKMRALLQEFKQGLSKLTYSQASLVEAPSPFVEMGLLCLSGGAAAWRSESGLCSTRKRMKYGPVAAE